MGIESEIRGEPVRFPCAQCAWDGVEPCPEHDPVVCAAVEDPVTDSFWKKLPPQTSPEDPASKRLLAAQYETHDYMQAVGQRVFSLEAQIQALRGEVEVVIQLLARVQPEQLSAVAEGMNRAWGTRLKRWLRGLLA